MADNTTLNTGSGGDTIATDDIGGIKHQRVKIQYGDDGAATDVSDTNPLPIDDAGGSLTVDNAGLTELAAAINVSSQMDVNIAAQAADITIADGGNTITVDGTVNAAQSGTWNVTNVSGTVSLPTGAATAANQSTANTSLSNLETNTTNVISTNNSTTTPLGVSGVYTGTAEDVSNYASVTIHLYANVASATDGMTFQFCDENTFAQPDTYSYTMAADENRRFQFPVTAQYFRVVYTNGGTGHTTFIVQTIKHTTNVLTSVHRLADNVDPDRSAGLVKSAILAQTSGAGDFVPIAANASGKLQVAAEVAGAETPADGDATPTDALHSQSFNMVYNGTTWDLVREGATAGSILVDGSNVTQPVSGTVTANAGTNLNTSALLTTAAHDAAFGTAGTADAQVRSVQGIASMTPLLVDATGQGDVPITLGGEAVVLGVGTSGGTTLYKNIDVDETAAGSTVKGSAGQLYWIHAMNLGTATRFLKIYNQTSITVGTTTPDLTFPLATQGDTNGAGFVLSIPNGIAFSTGIMIAATTGVADADSGAPGANEVIVNIGYA